MIALRKEQGDDGRALMTLEEYFRFCELTDLLYEFLHGRVYLMTGGSTDHGIISLNIGSLLKEHLHGGSCRIFIGRTPVQVAEDVVFLPDVTVGCDERDVGRARALSYPKVVVEVLTPRTERHDMTHKLLHYKECPSVQAIIFVDTQMRVVITEQRIGSTWDRWACYSGGSLKISCLDFEIPVDALYEGTSI